MSVHHTPAALALTAHTQARSALRGCRREATAAAEMIQAEKASKFAAEAETKAIAESLAATEEAMERERVVARKVRCARE